ncbi:MAG: hypothetical protein RIS29_2869 [Bacteroidota bacterium]|jgi:hypothetical protein
MKRRTIFIIICLFSLCIAPSLTAQNAKDSVYLTNDNLLIGKVYKYMPGKYLCIQTPSGQFTFEFIDIKKLAIHSVANYQDGIDEEIKPIKNETEAEPAIFKPKKTMPAVVAPPPTIANRPKSTNAGRSLLENEPATHALRYRSNSFYGDQFADNVFIVQGQINWSDKLPLLKKFQTIYARRIEQDIAIGGGMSLGFNGPDKKLVNTFCDVRKFLFVNNHYHSLAADFGFSVSDEDSSPYLCLSYNIGIRIQGLTFLQFGIHYSQERYGIYTYNYNYGYSYSYYSSNLHRQVGINAGILF